MVSSRTCLSCGAPLVDRLGQGPCPRCLARLAWGSDDPTADPDSVLFSPKRIGNYFLGTEIARGGMGVVYRATQHGLNRPVAVKVLLNGPFSDRESRERFLAEARTAAALRHPGIVAVHEVGLADGQPFFSMDLVEGSNLAALVSGQPLSAARAVRYMLQVAQAVAHAHQQGVLHRDLKPSNILIDDATDETRVTDFGLAKQTTLGAAPANLTQSGSQLGSPQYMPPEQIESRPGGASPASDVWSLGVIFYELLTGRPPFNGDGPMAIFRQVLQEDAVSPKRLNPGVPQDLETICLKCLRKDPRQRYPDAAALLDELRRFERHEPIQARPVSFLEKASLWSRRNPALAGAIGLAFLLAFAGTLGIIVQWRRAERLRFRAEDQARRAEAFSVDASLQAYAADMRVASDAFRDGNLGLARDRLNAWIPRPGTVDRREFTWRYLSREVESQSLGVIGRLDWIVTSVACSSDGQWFAAAGMNSPAKVWNAGTLAFAASFTNRIGTWQVGFMPNGQHLLVGGADGWVRIYSWPQARWVAEFPGQTFSISADGRRMVTCAGNPNQWEVSPGMVRLWELTSDPATWATISATPKWTSATADLVRATVSPDGQRVVTTDGRESLQWLDAATGIETGHAALRGRAWTLNFSPDGRRLAISGWGDSVRIFDVSRPAEEPRILRIAGTDLLDVAWSPDGQKLAVSATTDRRLRILEAQSGRTWLTLGGHDDEAWAVSFTPDGDRLLSGSKDQSVQLWSAEPRPAAREVASPSWSVPVWMDSTNLLVPSANSQSALWNVHSGIITRTLDGVGIGPGPVPSSAWIQTAGNEVRFQTADGKLTAPVRLQHHQASDPAGLRYHALSGTFWNLFPNGTFLEWDAQSGKQIDGFPTVAFPYGFPYERSPNGSSLAVGGLTNGVQIFAIPGGRLLWQAPLRAGAHMDSVDAFAFSPDGRLLASGGRDGKLLLWDAARGTRIAELAGHRGNVNAIAWSPDGLTLATTEAPLGIRLFHLPTRRETALLPIPNVLYWLKFSPDGQALAVLVRDPGTPLDQPTLRVRLVSAPVPEAHLPGR